MKSRLVVLLSLWLAVALDVCSMSRRYYYFDNLGRLTQNLCVRGMAQSGDGMIWLATEGGLYSFDGYHLVPRHLASHHDDSSGMGSFNCLVSAGDSLLIGTNRGLVSFNLTSYEFSVQPYAVDNVVKSIVCCDSTVWVATADEVYRNGVRLMLGLDLIISLYVIDRYLYIGTLSGIYRYSLASRQMERVYEGISRVSCFLYDGRGILRVGTASGLTALSVKDGGEVFSVRLPVVKALAVDGEGIVLVGTDNGFYTVDEDHHIESFVHDARNHTSLAGDVVWSVFNDADDNVWIGTNSGLSVVRNNKFMSVYPLPSITGTGHGNHFFCVRRDSRGRLWLGGSNGLLCIEDLGGREQSYRWYMMDSAEYHIGHNRIRGIFEDSRGRLFVCGDGGLMLYDESTRQLVRYKIEEDPHNWIYGVSEDSQGKLVVTSYVLTYIGHLDPSTHRFVVERTVSRLRHQPGREQSRATLGRYGLSGDYLSAYYDSAGGVVVLGGIDRFAMLRPVRPSASPSLAITDIRINGERYATHRDIVDGSLRLSADDRYVEVMFSDFDHSGSFPCKYQYRINGGGWVPVHLDNTTIMLADLHPGDNVLSVRPTDAPSGGVSYEFSVSAPWYASMPAMIVYALLLCCFLYVIYRVLKQRIIIREEQRRHQEFLDSARRKEEALQSDNEQLALQLKMRLAGDGGDGGDPLSDDERFLQRVTRLIEDNLSDSDLNVNVLSTLSGISSKQLYRRIKALTGMTTVAYIRDLRLKKAAALLSKGTYTVSEVMYMVGFNNLSYFTRCFTEEYKESPSVYKKQPQRET